MEAKCGISSGNHIPFVLYYLLPLI